MRKRHRTSRHRALQHVVDEDLDRPMRVHAVFDVLNEERIEICCRDLADRLLHDACAECVGTSDFKHVLAPGEHSRDEFVACKREQRALGVLIPGSLTIRPSRAIPCFSLMSKSTEYCGSFVAPD